MDSELQIALIGAGLAAVVLIIGYNKWQERKHRRQAEKAFKSEHRDVLLEPKASPGAAASGRREPGFGDPATDAEANAGLAADAPPSQALRDAPLRRSAPQLPEMLDERTDAIVRLEAIEAIDVQRVWNAQAEQLDGLSKPLRWFGFNDSDNLWFVLGPNSAGACHWFCAALQLVDRRGSIGETDFMRFSGGVQRVADVLMAPPPSLPARTPTLAQAAELDRFCADVDVQIGINVIALERPFEGRQIQQLAERHSLQLVGDGSFHAVDGDGDTLFTVGNLEAGLFDTDTMAGIVTRGLTFVIDVPCVRDGGQAFDRMMRVANDFATRLEGSVVDDNRTPFGSEAAAVIRGQILEFHDRMAGQGIPAGGALAKRLFALA